MFIADADADAAADTAPARLRTAAAARLLLHLAQRVDELAAAAADVVDLGHDRRHRVLTLTRKGGRRADSVGLAAAAAEPVVRSFRSS